MTGTEQDPGWVTETRGKTCAETCHTHADADTSTSERGNATVEGAVMIGTDAGEQYDGCSAEVRTRQIAARLDALAAKVDAMELLWERCQRAALALTAEGR